MGIVVGCRGVDGCHLRDDPARRTIQSLVADSIGRSWFTYGVLTALACAAAAAAWPLRMTGSNVAW